MLGGRSLQKLNLNNFPLLPTGTRELRVDLTDFDGNHNFAKYRSFQLQGEEEKYKLILGDFVGGGAGKQLWGDSGGVGWGSVR